MKRLHALALFCTLAGGSGAVLASSDAIDQSRPKVLPVLVQVDALGKVTEVSPATRLSPALDRLLRKNLAELITQPAKIHGQPVPSQFVINLALNASPRDNGGYQAQFSYVSTSPVPAGSWYWVNLDGRRLALADRHQLDAKRSFDSNRHNPDFRQPFAMPGRNDMPGSSPSAAAASSHASAPRRPRGTR